ncbi:hypothetical protein BZ164_01030 [Pseudomonas veronii]|jgi:hypothetical protein|nr:hypothetical protein BZ164_01030 [Pseudomonas veronii]
MISNHLSMVEALRPASNELAHNIEAFLSKGGTIQVLEGPNFRPPPVRHHPEPKPRKKKAAVCIAEPVKFLDKMALRDIERDERKVMREKAKADELEYIRGLAETMTYTQAILRTGMHIRSLQRLAQLGGFKFQPADTRGKKDLRFVDEERDARNATLIRELLARGFSRNQARESIQTNRKNFERLLAKFDIDYPKATKGPAPAFFAKPAKQA